MKSGHAWQVNRRRILLYIVGIVIFLILTLVVTALTMSSIYDDTFGPFDKDLDDLLALPESKGEFPFLFERWATIDIDANYPISASYIEYRDDGSLLDQFSVMVAQIDDYLLIIRADSEAELDLNTLHLTGNIWHDQVVPYMPYLTDVRGEFRQQYPNVSGEFLPLTFNISDEPSDVALAGKIVLVPLILISGILLLLLFRLITMSNKAGIMRKLARYGDPTTVLAEIDQQLTNGKQRCLDKYCFTDDWFVFAPFLDFLVVRYEDIMWVYKSGNNTIIHDRYGEKMNIDAPINHIVEFIQHKTPWAVHETTPVIKQQWKRNRQGFIDEVDAVRSEYEKSQKA